MRPTICVLPRVLCSSGRSSATVLCLGLLLCFFARGAHAQQYKFLTSAQAQTPQPEPSELFLEGYISGVGFKFASGENTSTIYYGGIEYDRRSSGTYTTRASRFWDGPAKLLHARPTYVFEVVPLDLIRQPIHTDFWGNALGTGRKTNPGIAISPLGFRWIWRDGKPFRQFWVVKLGEAVFAEKALGSNASYENFTVNSAIGFQTRLTETTDLRIACAYQHISNAYTNSDPGLDTVGPSFGIVYHFPISGKW